MNQIGGRGCGGVGLSLDKPTLELAFSCHKKIIVSGGDDYIANKTISFARNVIKHLGLSSGVKIEIRNSFPNHMGLGSGTQLGLSVGKGIAMLYKKDLPLRDIAFINRRAGVSGIGYYSFMYGGLIVDGGYRMGLNEDKKTFGDHALHPPSLIGRYEFPKNWKILLVMPPAHLMNNSVNESALFIKNTPVPLSEVEAICTGTLMGLIPGLLDKNYFEFIDNLFDIAKLGTKKIELELSRKSLIKAMDLLDGLLTYKWKRLGSCKYILMPGGQNSLYQKTNAYSSPAKRHEIRKSFVEGKNEFSKNRVPFLGVSSLGPAMYSVLSEDHHDIEYLLEAVKNKLGKDWNVEIVGARNSPCLFVN